MNYLFEEKEGWMTYDQCMEFRKELLSKFSDLDFVEDTHQYTLDGKNIKSVSSLIKYFKKGFDEDRIAKIYAKARGLRTTDVLGAWHGNMYNSLDVGHNTHLFGENFVISNFFDPSVIRPIPSSLQELAIIQYWTDLLQFKYLFPIATELKMYSRKYWYAGTGDALILDRRNAVLYIGDYKGLDINTPILTNNGWTTMGNLSIGDVVYDRDGKEATILATSSIKEKPCYEISLNTGEKFNADFEHRWLVTLVNNFIDTKESKVMTTEDIYNWITQFKTKGKYKVLIKRCKPLLFTRKELPIAPYVLGLWLGSNNETTINCKNIRVLSKLVDLGIVPSPISKIDNTKVIDISFLSSLLSNLNLNVENKHIPEDYLMSQKSDRGKLLKGLIDSIGKYNPSNKSYYIKVTNKRLLDSIITLINSLGGIATILKVFKEGEDYYEVKFPAPTVVWNRLTIGTSEDQNNMDDVLLYKTIVSVKKIDPMKTKCIEVNSPSRTFLAGYGLTVTHNTNKEIFDTPYNNYVLPPFLDTPETSFNSYTKQFSFYQIMLEEVGYKVGGRRLIWLQPNKETKKLYHSLATENITEKLKPFLESGLHLKD